MKLTYSRLFDKDLDDIATYISNDNPERAISFVDEIKDACKIIVNFPKSYPIAYLKTRKNVRKKVVGQYIIYFTIHPEFIKINRVLHGARIQKI